MFLKEFCKPFLTHFSSKPAKCMTFFCIFKFPLGTLSSCLSVTPCIHGLVASCPFSPHGGRIVWATLNCRFHTHIAKHSKTLGRKCQNLVFCREHVMSLIITELIKLSTTAHLKIEWHFVTGGVLLNLFQLWNAAPVEAENAAGLRVFMRRRAALQCMAAAVYSDRHSVHNLCCYQMPWEEDSEWGSLIH